mgnify:CR=1 FL=1|tara:strand:- start:4217 stop:6709 length:2493 start_codon:yes stop_codon:yes gene_type:complete
MKTISKLLLLLLFPILTFGQVSTLPHSTDFEIGFGDWTNSTFDNFDWTQTTTKTPSAGTGPQIGPPFGDLGSLGYVFTESSGANQSSQAWLECEYNLSSYINVEMTFAYYMYSQDGGPYGPGTLQLDVYDGTSWTFGVWSNSVSIAGWQMGYVDLSAYDGLPQVILSWTGATTGWQSDISLDNIIVTGTENIPLITSYPYEVDFETEVQHSTDAATTGFVFDKPGWRNASGDGTDWRVDAGGTPSVDTGPGSGATTGALDYAPGTPTGFYLYLESSAPNYPNINTYLLTPRFDLTSNAHPVMEFWYNMYGAGMGSLKMQMSIDGGTTWSADYMVISGDRGTEWNQVIFDMIDFRGETNVVFRLEGETSIDWNSDICIDNFRVLDMNTSPLDVYIDLNLASDAFSASNSTVNLVGNSIQSIRSNGYGFGILTVNNTNGIVLTDNLTTDKLALIDGIITTDIYSVYVTSTLWSALAGGSDISFINGNVRRYITSNTNTYGFPIGYGISTTNYHKVDLINNNMVGVSYIDAYVSDMSGGNNFELNTSEQTTQILEMADKEWFLTPDAQPTSGDYGVNLYLNGLAGALLSDDNFTVCKRPNGSITYGDWDAFDATTDIPTAGTNGRTIASGYGQKTGFSSFSGFGIGGSGGGPLPIVLLSFDAELNGDNVDVYWSVASQVNNDYYSILRSIDGYDWNEIGKIQGAGNSNSQIDYKFIDEDPYIGTSYYKLKQTDFDGNFEEFPPVSISYDVEIIGLLISPNPVTDILTLTMDGNLHNDLHVIRIFDSRGNIILRNNLIGNLKDYKVNVSMLSDGMYIVKVKNRRQLGVGKFIKE